MIEARTIDARTYGWRTAKVYAGYIGANLAVLLAILAAAVYLL